MIKYILRNINICSKFYIKKRLKFEEFYNEKKNFIIRIDNFHLIYITLPYLHVFIKTLILQKKGET
jgi:hypothetical protein